MDFYYIKLILKIEMNNFFLVLIIFLNVIFFYNLKKFTSILNLYDYPSSSRKIHKEKTSLLGGIIFFGVTLLFFLFDKNFNNNLKQYHSFTIIIPLILLFFVGYIDDKVGLSSIKKTFLFIIIIFFPIFFNGDFQISILKFSLIEKNIQLGIFSIFFTIICVFIFINSFNMYDGINGQAGIYSFVLFSYFLYKNINVNLSLAIIITLLFFLIFNFRGKVFLGDNGSIFISFLISLIIINSYNLEIINTCEEIFILMMLPGIDMTRLFIQRLLKKKNPLIADGNHFHHLMLKFFSSSSVLIINSSLIVLPILALIYGFNEKLIILTFLATYLVLFFFIKNN